MHQFDENIQLARRLDDARQKSRATAHRLRAGGLKPEPIRGSAPAGKSMAGYSGRPEDFAGAAVFREHGGASD
jgi:hypothetical protein